MEMSIWDKCGCKVPEIWREECKHQLFLTDKRPYIEEEIKRKILNNRIHFTDISHYKYDMAKQRI